MNETAERNPTSTSVRKSGPENEFALLSNFDPIAIGDEIAALEMEAQSKLADAKGEFTSRSEKIAAILWEVKCTTQNTSRLSVSEPRSAVAGARSYCRSVAAARRLSNLVRSLLSARAEAGRTERQGP